MVRYRLHCVGGSGNSFKVALFLNCAGLDWEPVGVDFAGGQTRDAAWRSAGAVQRHSSHFLRLLMGQVPMTLSFKLRL